MLLPSELHKRSTKQYFRRFDAIRCYTSGMISSLFHLIGFTFDTLFISFLFLARYCIACTACTACIVCIAAREPSCHHFIVPNDKRRLNVLVRTDRTTTMYPTGSEDSAPPASIYPCGAIKVGVLGWL